MKKLIATTLAVTAALSLSACQQTDPEVLETVLDRLEELEEKAFAGTWSESHTHYDIIDNEVKLAQVEKTVAALESRIGAIQRDIAEMEQVIRRLVFS